MSHPTVQVFKTRQNYNKLPSVSSDVSYGWVPYGVTEEVFNFKGLFFAVSDISNYNS